MLRYFKINAADRLLVLAVLLALLVVPAFVFGLPITLPEVQWLAVGEKLGQGALLYRDVWTDMAPLPALIYMVLVSLFGKSALVIKLVGMVGLVLMAFQYRRGSSRYQFFTERNALPVLVYVLLGLCSFDFVALTPVLPATFFLQLALFRIARHIRYSMTQEGFLTLGLYLGLATLCYAPCVLFILLPITAFVLYAGTSLRQYLITLLGFFLPLVAGFLFFMWMDAGADYYFNYLYSLVSIDPVEYIDARSLAYLFAVPALLTALAVVQINSTSKLINYQTLLLIVMALYLMACFGALTLSRERAPFQYLLFLPALTFFLVHLYNLIENFWIGEAFFLLLLVAASVNLLSPALMNRHPLAVVHLEPLLATQAPPLPLRNESVLILGQDVSYYLNNQLATPYLNPQLARRHFQHLDDYETVLQVFERFRADMPAYIIDQDTVVPQLFQRLPVLEQFYKPAAQPNVYQIVADDRLKPGKPRS